MQALAYRGDRDNVFAITRKLKGVKMGAVVQYDPQKKFCKYQNIGILFAFISTFILGL